jgi:predicted PurR-regulated permease PerM
MAARPNFGFFFIATLSALGLWIIVTTHTNFSLNSRIIQLPNFGPVIAAIPAILLGLTLGTSVVCFVACLYVLIQIIQSAVTHLFKEDVEYSTCTHYFGQVVMGLMAGFWGVLLATPVVVIIMILVNKLYIERQASQIK